LGKILPQSGFEP